MKKNITYYFFILLIISLFIFLSCTENGVELSLIGTWELIDYDIDSDYIDDVQGTLVIYSNDTYDNDITYEVTTGGEVEINDTGTLKACHVNKFIQFFSDKDDFPDVNYTYILDSNILELEKSDGDIYTFQKSY